MGNRLFKLTTVIVSLLLFATTVSAGQVYRLLHSSKNLSDYIISAECNPGGGTNCPCSQADVELRSEVDYGVVTSNPFMANTWANAISGKKIIENYPDDGSPVKLGIYKYSGKIRLPQVPVMDLYEMPQNAHMGVFLWDGRNELLQADKVSFEAVMFWELNPWSPDIGKLKLYTTQLNIVDTGIKITPDTNWHTFELIVDYIKQEYVSVTFDGVTKDLTGIKVANVYRPDWGNEVALITTAESLAAWPLSDCRFNIKWSTHFSDLEFGMLE